MARLFIQGMCIRIVIIPGMGRLMIGTITGTEVVTGSDTGTGTGMEIGTEAAQAGDRERSENLAGGIFPGSLDGALVYLYLFLRAPKE